MIDAEAIEWIEGELDPASRNALSPRVFLGNDTPFKGKEASLDCPITCGRSIKLSPIRSVLARARFASAALLIEAMSNANLIASLLLDRR